MFKKLLSTMTVMLLAFCMNAGAQSLQVHKMGAVNTAPKFAAAPRTSVIDLAADEMWMGYWNGAINENTSMLGVNGTPMQYDIAICYPAGSLKLKVIEVTGIRFTFPDSENVENLRIWMSTTAPVTAEQADIVCDKVTEVTGLQNAADPVNEIRFSKPYKVDYTKPLYIGYSFDINNGQSNAENFPVIIDMGAGDMENALLIKLGGEYGEWMDYNGFGYGVAAIQMLVKASLPGNAITVPAELPDAKSVVNSSEITFPVENAGTNPLTSIKVATSADGVVLSESEYTFEEPLIGIGSQAEVTITSAMPEKSGLYQFGITITEVNGEVLEEPVNTGMNMTVVSEKVTRRPLMEEFTSMNNGWAPRGIIAYDKLNNIHGDALAYITVHIKDDIACPEYAPIYNSLDFYPAANLDRQYMSIDPYYGSDKTEFGINKDVTKAKSVITVADVSAEISLKDNIIDATSNVKFLYSEELSHYALGYVLVEDFMTNEAWKQSNAYINLKGEGLEDTETMFDFWVNGPEQVSGLTYNNVAIATLGIEKGIQGSILSPITEGATVTYTAQFDLANYPAIQNTDNLRVVAILFDYYHGYVENTATARMKLETSVKGVDTGNVKETARYAVDGSKISAPQQGINIVKYSDGSIKKIVVR